MSPPPQPNQQAGRVGNPVHPSSWRHQPVRAGTVGRLARMCWFLDARRWIVAVSNILAAALFVAGCIGFYWPGWYTPSVTAFLCGSVLFLFGALASALLEHGPST